MLLIEKTDTFIKKPEDEEKKSEPAKSNLDVDKLVPLAMQWLKAKFGDNYEFKHKQQLSEIGKTYYAAVNGEEFGISGKKYDTTGDGKPDTVLFKIIPTETPEDEEIPFGE